MLKKVIATGTGAVLFTMLSFPAFATSPSHTSIHNWTSVKSTAKSTASTGNNSSFADSTAGAVSGDNNGNLSTGNGGSASIGTGAAVGTSTITNDLNKVSVDTYSHHTSLSIQNGAKVTDTAKASASTGNNLSDAGSYGGTIGSNNNGNASTGNGGSASVTTGDATATSAITNTVNTVTISE